MSTLKADSVTASSGVNTNLALTGKGTGKVALGDAALTVPDTDGSANQYLRTTGEAALEFATLPAIPAEAFTGFRNLIINGDMAVAQRGTSTADLGSGSGYFTLDRWQFNGSSSGRFTMTQTADGPSGIANCMKLDCTTADTSIAATESLLIRQHIEGQNLQGFKKGTADAETFAVSFWAKQNAERDIIVYLSDEDNTRHVSNLVTVGTSWARHTITFPADTTGAFDDDNAKSFYLGFLLHRGSDGTSGTLATAWEAYDATNVAPGIDSFYSSTSNTFFLTGVQLEVGSSATDFERVPWDYQLSRCERYYQTYGMGFRAFGIDASTIDSQFAFRTMMRSSPSVTLLDTTPTFTQIGVANRTGTSSSITTSAQGPDGTGLVRVDGFSSVGVSSVCVGNQNTPIFGFDAEL